MVGTARRTACIAVLIMPLVSACGLIGGKHNTSPYDLYKGYLSKDSATVRDLEPLPERTVKDVAAELCSYDYARVKSVFDLLTKPLANGYDSSGVGLYQAARISKAYCKDYTKAFYYLMQVVTTERGASAAYTVPQ